MKCCLSQVKFIENKSLFKDTNVHIGLNLNPAWIISCPISSVNCRYKQRTFLNSLAALTVDSTVWFERGMHSTHLVNRSIIIKINKFFFLLIGRGPKKSKWILSMGDPAWESLFHMLSFWLLFYFYCIKDKKTYVPVLMLTR